MDGMLYRVDDDGYTPIGRVSDMPEIALDFDKEEDAPVLDLSPQKWSITVNLNPKSVQLTNHSIRWFRKYLGIDILPIAFPRKKNRRRKRLMRRMSRLITEIGKENAYGQD